MIHYSEKLGPSSRTIFDRLGVDKGGLPAGRRHLREREARPMLLTITLEGPSLLKLYVRTMLQGLSDVATTDTGWFAGRCVQSQIDAFTDHMPSSRCALP